MAGDEDESGEVAGDLVELEGLVVADREVHRVVDAGVQGYMQSEFARFGIDRVQEAVVDGDAEERRLQVQPFQSKIKDTLYLGQRPRNFQVIHGDRAVAGEPPGVLCHELWRRRR